MELKILNTEITPLENDWFHIHIEFDNIKNLDFYIKPRIELRMDNPSIPPLVKSISTFCTGDADYGYHVGVAEEDK